MPFPLSSLYPALSFLWAAFTLVSIVTTSIVSLTVKRNLADVSRDPTPCRRYFDALSPYLPRTNFLAFLLLTAAPSSKYLQVLGDGSPPPCEPGGEEGEGDAGREGRNLWVLL